MKNAVLISILTALLIIIGYFSYGYYKLENQKRELKEDWVELSDIKYGMLNADHWRDQFAEIISKKINELSLSNNDKSSAKKAINEFLYKTIDDFEKDFKDKNRKKSVLGISLKNIGADIFNIFSEMRTQVPSISDRIIDFIEDEGNKQSIKGFVLKEIEHYRETTFQEVDYSKLNSVLIKYGFKNQEACSQYIQSEISKIDQQISDYNLALGLCLSIVLIIIFLGKNFNTLQISLFIAVAVIFLILGISLPMINIDARISSLSFHLMGESISFNDQILFYKSKSILEVAQIMISQSDIKVVIVGFLVLLFSVVFPIIKLSSSFLMLLNSKLRSNQLIRFFVFKLGKWSMADVLVVAIFMSYLGFSSILSSQLGQMEHNTETLSVFTTNYSELQFGFYYFLVFVIISIRVSQLISNKLRLEEVL